MRVAIYGAGAMGTLLGAYISAAGKDVDLISRNVGHITALKERGARVVGHDHFETKVTAITPDEMSGVYDIVFLMTKQRENSKVLPTIHDFLADDGVVCTLQNGLPEPSVMEVVGRKRCLGCAVSWGANTVEDGTAALTSKKKKMTFYLGSMDGHTEKVNAVKEYLECAGKVVIEENFFGARWSKLALNSALSPLSAVTGLTFGEVAKKKQTRELALLLLNEAFAVAEECGVTLEPIQGYNIVQLFKSGGKFKQFVSSRLLYLGVLPHKNIISGMYFDLKDKKKCDIDFINGVILRLGSKFGVKTPVNEEIVNLCHEIENGGREIIFDNVQMLYDKMCKNNKR